VKGLLLCGAFDHIREPFQALDEHRIRHLGELPHVEQARWHAACGIAVE
jgi:hypothetical protein